MREDNSARDGMGGLGCGILALTLLGGAGCSWLVWDAHHANNVGRTDAYWWLRANGNRGRVVGIYAGSDPGASFVVVEGLRDRRRRSLPVRDAAPGLGELWVLRLGEPPDGLELDYLIHE